MFQVMTFQKSIKGKLTSALVSLSVLALTIVGAFAVSFNRAEASPGSAIFLSDLQQRVEQYHQSQNITNFFNWLGSYYSSSLTPYTLICACQGDYPDEIAITVWRSPYTYYDGGLAVLSGGDEAGAFGFREQGSSQPMSTLGLLGAFVMLHNEESVSTLYYRDWVYQYYNLSADQYTFGAGNLVYPNASSMYEGMSIDSYSYYYSLTLPDGSTRNLLPSPVSAYDNVVIEANGRYYFTTSDNGVIRDAYNNNIDAEVYLIFDYGGDNPLQVHKPAIDFTYLPNLTTYPGITNISPNGVLAWDFTDIVNSYTINYLVSSAFTPRTEFPDYFSNVGITITKIPGNDPWVQFYDYVNSLLEIVNSPNHISPNNPPSYVTQNVYTSYKDMSVAGGGMSDAGNVLMNEIPSVPMDTILVCSTKLFDDLGNKVDLLNVSSSTTQFINYLSPYLLQQIDLIVVLPENSFEAVLQGQPDHPDNFVDWNPYQWNVGVASGPHGYFYYTSPSIRDTTVNDVSGFAFCTERYLEKCRNYMLSDGIESLYLGLNNITTNQDSIINAIVSGTGSVYSQIQAMGIDSDSIPYLKKLYNLLFSLNLSDKLDSIIDKLDKIGDNTDEQTHDYWFISLYNWIVQYAPSNSDFANWVSNITSFENSLPDPEATPAATVIPFPTVTASAG